MMLVRDFYRHEEALRRRVRDLARMPAARMLDVGCRTGDLTQGLAEGKAWCAALDVRRFPEWRQRTPHLTWLQADAMALPFRDGSFDLVVSSECLQYVADWRQALDEMHRVLTPSGVLVLSCPNGNPMTRGLDPYNLSFRVGRFLDRRIARPELRSRLRPRSRPRGTLVHHPSPAAVMKHPGNWRLESADRRGSLTYIYLAFMIDNLEQLRLRLQCGGTWTSWLARGPLTAAIRGLFRVMRWDFALRLGPLSYNAIYRFRKAGPAPNGPAPRP